MIADCSHGCMIRGCRAVDRFRLLQREGRNTRRVVGDERNRDSGARRLRFARNHGRCSEIKRWVFLPSLQHRATYRQTGPLPGTRFPICARIRCRVGRQKGILFAQGKGGFKRRPPAGRLLRRSRRRQDWHDYILRHPWPRAAHRNILPLLFAAARLQTGAPARNIPNG